MTEAPAFDIISLRPADTPDYMTDAWLGCINFALSEPSCIAAFRRDTGNRWQPGRTALERMIDEACGADAAFLRLCRVGEHQCIGTVERKRRRRSVVIKIVRYATHQMRMV